MKKASYLIGAFAIGAAALATSPSSANPLAGGLAIATSPSSAEAFVQKVHGNHCKRKFSNRRGWHRHRRACYGYNNYYYDDDYYDDYYNDYAYYGYPYRRYPYGYPGYGLGFPFFSFGIGGWGGHHRHWHD
jgi:hypothetical protein